MKSLQGKINHPGPEKDALQLASALSQPDNEPVASYIARFKRKLRNVSFEAHKELVINALNGTLAANNPDYWKCTRDRKEREAFKRFKEACVFPYATGCWICGKDNYHAGACPGRPNFDHQHPKLSLSSLVKAKQA